MGTALGDALGGQSWSFGAVVRGLDHALDGEGRPLGERRAPSVAKDGVEILLKACPYRDERNGAPMNVSALAQVSRHQEQVLAELSQVVAACGEQAGTWEAALAAVLHLLSAPALFALRARDPEARIPAATAVGHKLAAGFYGVVRSLVARTATALDGDPVPVSEAALRAVVCSDRALFGASEVCAGPPNMLSRATRVLLGQERVSGAPPPDPDACMVTRILTHQVRAGLAWELLDGAESHVLLRGELTRADMHPRNHYMAARLDEHLASLPSDTPREPALVGSRLVRLVSDGGLCEALSRPLPAREDPDVRALISLFAHGDQAIELTDDVRREWVARRAVRFLRAYARVLGYQWHAEMALRERLGFAQGVPVCFDPSVLYRGRAMVLFEALLGHRVACPAGPSPALTLRNHKRELVLAVR